MVASNQYTEKIIAVFGQAAEANRQTPGRQGNVVVLTAAQAEDVMVTGDLHGHRRNFNLICRLAALDEHPRRHLILQEVCHGGPTYPQSGGCMSHAMLEDVARLKTQYPSRVHFILGNHELAELTDYPIQKNRQMLNLLFWLGLQQMYGPAAEHVRAAFRAFLRTCPLAVRLSSGVFITHTVPENVDSRPFDATIFDRALDPEEYHGEGDVFRLLWGRDFRAANALAFAKLVRPGSSSPVTSRVPKVFVSPTRRKSFSTVMPSGRPI